MKTFKTVTTASVLALMMANPVYAADVAAKDQNKITMKDVQRGLQATGEDIKAFFLGVEEDAKFTPVLIRGNMTASGLIGQSVINAEGKNIATVRDIIIGRSGKASQIVVSDHGGVLGIGNKVAAFDYNKVVTQRYDGTIVLALSEEMIKRAADFSYDPQDWAKAKVIQEGHISTQVLLGGNVLDNNEAKVASIDNIYFRHGDVTQIIIGFDKTLGIGGSAASVDYDDMRMIRRDGGLNFKLTAAQSAHFKDFKASVLN